MNDAKYIGLDVHQATISVAVLDSAGKLVMEAILETKAEVSPRPAHIFAQEDVPEKSHAYIETNKSYVDGGKFQRDKYQKASSRYSPRRCLPFPIGLSAPALFRALFSPLRRVEVGVRWSQAILDH